MSKPLLKRLVPDRDAIVQNRWIRWMGPKILHPRLWAFSRRGVALGAAVGVFFGFLIPIAQIPASAIVAVLLRAYVPAAVGSTLVTNPVTFAPVYYFAHQLGAFLLGEDVALPPDPSTFAPVAPDPERGLWQSVVAGIDSMGKPLVTGLVTLAVFGSLGTYGVVMLLWRLKTTVAWRNRRKATKRGEEAS